jgi:hypothetical protein
MIKFITKDPKKWAVLKNKNVIMELDLATSTITNRFSVITDFIENLSTHFKSEFDSWFESYLRDVNSQTSLSKYEAIHKNIPMIKEFVNRYICEKKTDFTKFVDETKAKKSSILFSAEDIEKIIKLSHYLKVYSVISNDSRFKLNQKLHKKIYNELGMDVTNNDLIFKIFNVVKTKTFRYNLTDRYMWDYIKIIQCKTIDVHVIEIFNFIMNSIIVLCEEEKNPITYFVSVIDESIKWFLRSVYKGSIVYDDSISTEDIHGANIDNLKTYCYNDTLGRLKKIAYDQSNEYLSKMDSVLTFAGGNSSIDDKLTRFQNELGRIKYISPLCECLVFPILSKITNIPYEHFKTLSPEHASILSLYVQDLLNQVFGSQYRDLFKMLSYYPEEQPSIATTYKIKTAKDYVNIMDKLVIFGSFKSKIPLYKVLNFFIGRLSRGKFINILDGEELVGLPLSKIEVDMVSFYTDFFSGNLAEKLEEVKKLMGEDF